MLVVSDATPLNVLVRINHVTVLPRLFQTVLIPPAVERELSHTRTPPEVRDWLATKPHWLEVRAPREVDPTLTRDPGEREAICLAREIHAEAILLDDLRARRIAQRLGLHVIGTIAILARAAERKLVSLPEALLSLQKIGFRISDDLVQQVLKQSNH